MAITKTIHAAETVLEGFDALHTRFMSLLSRLQVLSEVLDCDKVPNELAPAAYVLRDTAKDAEQLWEDAEGWYMDHEHAPEGEGGAIMSKTPIRAAESKSDDFNGLMFRFLGANERLKLAAHALTRAEDIDISPATFVVEEVTEALEQLRGDLEHWERDNRHAPEAKEVQS